METTPLIVLDTNVLVSGLCRRENSASYLILQYIQKGKIPVALSYKLYLEYESVLKRKKILALINATVKEVSTILDALVAIAHQSEVFYLWRPNLTDENDNFVLETAITTGAMIVTKNIKDFQEGELKFPELLVLTPSQFSKLYL